MGRQFVTGKEKIPVFQTSWMWIGQARVFVFPHFRNGWCLAGQSGQRQGAVFMGTAGVIC